MVGISVYPVYWVVFDLFVISGRRRGQRIVWLGYKKGLG